jgi:hypothetical protein
VLKITDGKTKQKQIMKKLVLAIIALVGLWAVTANAQNQYMTNAQGQVYSLMPTQTTPGSYSTNPPVNGLQQFTQFFTAFNTNLINTFSPSNNYEVFTGVSYSSSVFLGGLIGFEAQPFSGVRGLTLRTCETLAPQAGTIADAEFDLGYSFTYIDVRITPYLGCQLANKNTGQNQPESLALAGGLEVQKAIGKNSFVGLYAEATSRGKGAMVFGLETGFTF